MAVSVAGIIIAWYYQDEVKRYIVGELNKNIRTEVVVDDISFSALRKFPQASVRFKDVLVRVPAGYDHSGLQFIGSDTLLTAQSLFLQFNIRDIFSKEYRINSIHAAGGVLYLAVNSREEENFRFWEPSGQEDDGFNLDLQDVRLDNYRMKFENSIKNTYIDSDVRRLEMQGDFSRSSYRLRGRAAGAGREFRHEGFLYSGHQDFSLSVSINADESRYVIEEGSVDLSGIMLTAGGEYVAGEAGSIDMNFRGSNLNIASVIPLLPIKNLKELETYRFKGKFDFEATVTGRLSKNSSPSIRASFHTSRGEIIRPDTGMRLTEISLSGYYSNGSRQAPSSSSVTISHFSSVFGKGRIGGKGVISNFSQPSLDIDLDALIYLEELAAFHKPEKIMRMKGRVSTVLSLGGPLQAALKLHPEEIDKLDIEGVLEIENGLMEIRGGRHIASEIEGKLHFGKMLNTDNFSFNIGSDHFSIAGEIDNGLPWLLGSDKTMVISGKFYSGNLNLDNYIPPSSEGRQSPGVAEPLSFPSNLELSLDFLVDDFRFRKFSSAGFMGKLSYKPRMMILNSVEFRALDGSVSGNGVIAQRHDGDFMLQSQLQMSDLDMQKMFYAFNNFGQTFIGADNLNGILTGNLGIISEWSGNLQIRWNSLIADSQIEIRNGELIDFEPMLGLARFIELSELQRIRFSTLANEIYIRNEVVTIPLMDINSSAFNISGSGTHRFDGHFDYHLRVLLSDVLYGKARGAKPENQQFGIVEADGPAGTSLYLLISGTSDNYRVSYDHRTARDVIRENIARERTVLRRLLHEEFGWYSTGTPVVSDAGGREESGSGFIIVWDEEDEKSAADSVIFIPPVRERERRFRIIWDEEEP